MKYATLFLFPILLACHKTNQTSDLGKPYLPGAL
jgi:hypothetical protein